MTSIDFSTVPSPDDILQPASRVSYSPTLYVCGKNGYPAGCAYTNRKNFSPRVGLAWSLDSKTVIRAGGGIYYGTQDGNTLLKMAQTLPTTYAQTLTENAYVPSVNIGNVFTPAVVGTASVQAAAIDPHQGTPYTPEWSFNIQRSLGADTMIQIGYLGTAGVHLEQNVQVNNGMPGTAVKRPFFGLTLNPSVVSALAFPSTTNIVPVTTINYFPHSAHSNYHALMLRAEHKFTHGFSLLSAFTLSKALSDAPQYRNDGGITGDENSPPQNSFDLAADRGPAYFNAKYRWVTSGVYELPFGKGKSMLQQGAGAAVLGGWQVSGILQLQTGFPYTINYKGDPVNIGGGSGGILIRPNYVVNSGWAECESQFAIRPANHFRVLQYGGLCPAHRFLRRCEPEQHGRRQYGESRRYPGPQFRRGGTPLSAISRGVLQPGQPPQLQPDRPRGERSDFWNRPKSTAAAADPACAEVQLLRRKARHRPRKAVWQIPPTSRQPILAARADRGHTCFGVGG